MYKCELCEQEFKSKRILEQHENKKNKCNIVTDFQCDKCNKYFKYKKNLKEHTEKDICKSTQIILLDENKTSEGIHDTESLAILIKSIFSFLISLLAIRFGKLKKSLKLYFSIIKVQKSFVFGFGKLYSKSINLFK